MESSISRFYGAMSDFLSHVQSSSEALTESLSRRPIPLDSATTSFTQRLAQRVSAVASDLELLEDMAMGTVSVAELLGHMSEVHKRNQDNVSLLQDRLSAFGYIPESDLDEIDGEELNVSEIRSSTRGLDEDDLWDVSESLRDVGFSDACLATLASEECRLVAAEDNAPILDGYLEKYSMTTDEKESQYSSEDLFKKEYSSTGSQFAKDDLKSRASIDLSRADYDKLPTYMKSLASWEDLLEAVTKINQQILEVNGSKNHNFKEADLDELGLGRKGKSYILALIKMNKLVVETECGSVIYRVALDGID